MKICRLLVCFIFIFFSSAKVLAQQAGFILEKGGDTISVERFSRSNERLEGRILVKNRIPVVFEAKLTPGSLIQELAVDVPKLGMPEGGESQQQATLVFKGDKIIAITKKNSSISKDTIQTQAEALVYHPNLPMLSLLEQIILRARNLNSKDVQIPVFLMSTNGQTAPARINFIRKDSAVVSLGSMKLELKLDGQGNITKGKTNSGQLIKRVKSIPDKALSTTAPDYSAPADAPYTAENIQIKTDAGLVLAGTLTLPKNAKGAVPVVVTISGSSPQDRDHNTPFGGPYRFFRNLADTLGRSGIAVLRMDDRGVGESTGNLEKATTAERADDNRAAIEFVRNHKEINQNQIFLLGLSEGGVIAPMIAATDPDLKGIVIMAGPGSTGKKIMEYQVKMGAELVDSLSSEEKGNIIDDRISRIEEKAKSDEWLEFFLNYDPLATAREVKQVPVLILQGEKDKNVPPEDAKALKAAFEKAGNKNVTLQMFENVNHIFVKDKNGYPQNYENLESFEVAPEIMRTIVSWLLEHSEE